MEHEISISTPQLDHRIGSLQLSLSLALCWPSLSAHPATLGRAGTTKGDVKCDEGPSEAARLQNDKGHSPE